MRRKDREITEISEIMEIVKKCDVCNLAFFDEKYPYIVPLNFGAANIDNKVTLYFHGAKVGKKLELLEKNNMVGFEMDCSHKLLMAEMACDSTMEFESVCGNGIIEILEEDQKIAALTILMNQYEVKEKHEFNENHLKAIVVLKLTVNEITGKRLMK